MKGGTYKMTLAKIQVRGIFHMRDIRLDELQYGGRNQQKHLLPTFATKARIYSSRNS